MHGVHGNPKNRAPNAVFYEAPVFASPSHERNYEVDEEKLLTSCKWFSYMKTVTV